jgi:hypothetical protein
MPNFILSSFSTPLHVIDWSRAWRGAVLMHSLQVELSCELILRRYDALDFEIAILGKEQPTNLVAM